MTGESEGVGKGARCEYIPVRSTTASQKTAWHEITVSGERPGLNPRLSFGEGVRVLVKEPYGGRDAVVERTGMYSQRAP